MYIASGTSVRLFRARISTFSTIFFCVFTNLWNFVIRKKFCSITESCWFCASRGYFHRSFRKLSQICLIMKVFLRSWIHLNFDLSGFRAVLTTSPPSSARFVEFYATARLVAPFSAIERLGHATLEHRKCLETKKSAICGLCENWLQARISAYYIGGMYVLTLQQARQDYARHFGCSWASFGASGAKLAFKL